MKSNDVKTKNHLISILPSQLVASHMMRNDHPGLVPFRLIQDVLFASTNKQEEEIKPDHPFTGSDDSDSNYCYLPCCRNCGAALQPGWNGTSLRLESSASAFFSSSCLGAVSSASVATEKSKTIPRQLSKVERRRLARKRHRARKQCQKIIMQMQQQQQKQRQQRKQPSRNAIITSPNPPHNILPQHSFFPVGPPNVKLRSCYKNWLVLTCGFCGTPTVIPGALVATRQKKPPPDPMISSTNTKDLVKQALLPGKRALAPNRSDKAEASRKQSSNSNFKSGLLSSLPAASPKTTDQSQQLGDDFISLPTTTTARSVVQGNSTSSRGGKRPVPSPANAAAKAKGTLQVPTERQTLHHLAANKKKKRKPDQLMSFLSSLNDP